MGVGGNGNFKDNMGVGVWMGGGIWLLSDENDIFLKVVYLLIVGVKWSPW